ncbi:cytochrome P450 [Streptomyces sp. NPDC056669]|uniref:cytochrome P450 n=1 Tax=unclassified Streptomyces TaxID=2593676 RepID=UPI003649C6F2
MPSDVIFDPADPGFLRDRYSTHRRLREEAPVLWTSLNGRRCGVVTQYADVDAVLREKRARVQHEPGAVPAHIGAGPAAEFYRNSLPCLDPPDHTRLRGLIMPAFTPRRVQGMCGWIAEIVDDILDSLRGRLPSDDVVGALLAGAEGGDRLSRTELVTTLIGLLVAGYHTTRVSLTSAIHSLLRNPGQSAALRAEPGLAANAWIETLRFDAPVHFVWRDLPGRGRRRTPRRRHALSRWEGEVFLTRLFARFPDAEVAADEPVRSHDLTFASIEALPLRLGRAA